MQFSTKAASLQPHQEGALLYICRNRENAPDNETARLLLESLAEGERFAAAQTAESGKLKAVAVALPENDGRDALEKAAAEYERYAAAQRAIKEQQGESDIAELLALSRSKPQ